MNFPRRSRIDLQTPIEAAIRAARDAVESGPAHPHMTRATVLLGQALDAVADFVDGVPEKPANATAEPGEAEVEAMAKVLADANADYVNPRAGVEGKRFGVDMPDRFCAMYRYMATSALLAMRTTPRAGASEGEPVAWAVLEGRDVITLTVREDSARREWRLHDEARVEGEVYTVVPLYARPTPPPAETGVEARAERFAAAAYEAYCREVAHQGYSGGEPPGTWPPRADDHAERWRAVGRAIEAAERAERGGKGE